jgi:UTP-glucose-1-phosphate uridylyltransferase
MEATLVIMAAGMGSRYGGEKQTDKIGPNGETLMEYSIFDAIRAGFTKVVFIIKPEMLQTVKQQFGDILEKKTARNGKNVRVEYAFQDFRSVPDFYAVPSQREKPFGTVHAVLCARKFVNEPFAVINADDYYGIDSFRTMYDSLTKLPEEGKALMVGYYLKNTVSEHGTVTRGVCQSIGGKLAKVTETYKIMKMPDGTIRDTASSEEGVVLDPESLVSMNFWGFSPRIFDELDTYFCDFLKALPEDNFKSECLLPAMVDALIGSGRMEVAVLPTESTWFGMTYKEDRGLVAGEIMKLHGCKAYPETLR